MVALLPCLGMARRFVTLAHACMPFLLIFATTLLVVRRSRSKSSMDSAENTQKCNLTTSHLPSCVFLCTLSHTFLSSLTKTRPKPRPQRPWPPRSSARP
ncbi:hypothetical protein IWX92DRAFT_362701 [Phyllosticta citricarpa]